MPVAAHAASIRQTTSPRQAGDTCTGLPQPGHMTGTTAQLHRAQAACRQLIAAKSGLDALYKAQVTSAPRRNLSDKSPRPRRPGVRAARQKGRPAMSMEGRKVGSVRYQEAGTDYFTKRGLNRHAAFWSLWSLGVAAVISGDFYGWNLGLDAGGFGGLLIATGFIAVVCYGLCFSIAEMSPALPHTGGAYSFARSAMGPWGGFITGLAENMEYVITPAVVVGAMGFLMHDIVRSLFNIGTEPWLNSPVTWWAIFYVVFVWINIIGIEATMRFTVLINILALGILAFFFISVLVSGKFNGSLLFNIKPDPGQSSFLPHGLGGIFPAIPFAIWFYLAIEELPLAAEESHDPKRDVPRATIWGISTLVITGALTLVLNPAVDGGAAKIGVSATPLFDGFKGVFGAGTAATLLALIGLVGLIASFFTIN